MRRITTAVVTLGIGTGVLLATAPPATAQREVSTIACITTGGHVVSSSSSPTGMACRGGPFNGAIVLP